MGGRLRRLGSVVTPTPTVPTVPTAPVSVERGAKEPRRRRSSSPDPE